MTVQSHPFPVSLAATSPLCLKCIYQLKFPIDLQLKRPNNLLSTSDYYCTLYLGLYNCAALHSADIYIGEVLFPKYVIS